MIELITGKELGELWIKLQEVIERTKRHTIQIKELERRLKDGNNNRNN